MTIGLQFKLSTNATTFPEVSLLSTDFSAMNEARYSSHDPSLGKHALTRTLYCYRIAKFAEQIV